MHTTVVIPLLALHLFAMNVAAAGPLFWSLAIARARADDAARIALARRTAWQSLVALGVGMLLGALLLAAPSTGVKAALARFPASTYWYAGAELAFSALWTAGIFWATPRLAGRPWLSWFLGIVPASNLLYHFPPLMTVFGKLASDPAWAEAELIDRPALLDLWFRTEVLSLWVHVVLASIAVAAIVALWPPRHDDQDAADQETDKQARAADGPCTAPLAWTATVTTALQFPIGIWVFAASEARVRDALTGADVVASAAMFAGVMAAVSLLKAVANVALGDAGSDARRRAAWHALAVTLIMAATLVLGRRTPAPAPQAVAAQANGDLPANSTTIPAQASAPRRLLPSSRPEMSLP